MNAASSAPQPSAYATPLQTLKRQHPGLSGVLPLVAAPDAFATRVWLARQAQHSLDLQYYIWRHDRTGTLLFEELHAAADRGVQVRLLLDDHNTAGLDAILFGLQRHPNIQIKLFNPLKLRRPRWLNYLLEFRRLNRRMHNKALIVDQQVLVSGGRNIGDEYFGATDDRLFADLDAVMVGPVVDHAVSQFESYWQCSAAVPINQLITLTKPQQLSLLAQRAHEVSQDPKAQHYMQALRDSNFVQQLIQHQLEFVWCDIKLVADAPSKIMGRARGRQLLSQQLQEVIGQPQQRVRLVSPYFVPTATGVKLLTEMAARGVHISILTNALEATDVAVVHSGYAKWRKPLLRAGIELFELQRISPLARKKERQLRRQRLKGKERLGSSASSLHAKTFSVDQQRVFLGSFNFDPRSAQLNTELGFVIHSEVLAKRIDDAFVETVPNYAYSLVLEPHVHAQRAKLVWQERLGSQISQYHSEPGTSWWRRMGMKTLALLPIDWLL
ncbi:phospholipase D family protein [Pseudidiomarina sp. WS423]|uniref:phospholipase D family protein n=1 Tax=Pseudidiomarina sp. WS423 TaxID=3425124 RepID=UPI003D6F5A93